MADNSHNPELEALWLSHRGRLLNIGYRMLGSVSEAEDIAGETCARLVAADLDQIEDPLGWMTTVASRLCLDRLRSADVKRRAYVGPWLPEPVLDVPDTGGTNPADRITLDDSVRLALLVVLEHLSPAERTSFVLHDLFAMTFEEIGPVVGRSAAACRQLASRARRRIQSHPESPKAVVNKAELDEVAHRFAAACGTGTVEPLLEVLDPNVVGDFDSGGAVAGAPVRAVDGAERVAAVLTVAFVPGQFTFGVQNVNGDPGVVVRAGDQIVSVLSLGIHNGRIDLIHGVGNPDKLRHLMR